MKGLTLTLGVHPSGELIKGIDIQHGLHFVKQPYLGQSGAKIDFQ